jgi:phosphoribosylformimino-5-aminoimidazole carboxamide ribotide isomerase
MRVHSQGETYLKVVPVIDILDGLAVHAVKGVRSNYKPVKSVLTASADAVRVAIAFKKLGFKELYVADLNAIMGDHDNFSVIKRIAGATRLQLIVDAGVNDLKKASQVIRHGASKVIIGTETLNSINFIAEAIDTLGTKCVVTSLDMKNGQLLSKLDPSRFSNPIEVLRIFQRMGLTQAILLDLARVGSEEGVDVAFLKKILECVDVNVLVGGGIRDINDLLNLKELGVFGVLLATSLHSGKINVKDLRRACLNFS